MSNSSSTIPLPSKSPKSPIDSSPASQENISYHTPLCSHSPQCVIRQPHPPPPDKCSVMQHSGSLYHEHMVSEMGVPSRYNTHEYCMRIEYQNYGCDNCIWFKWWGELHEYPDINPWSFREHLEPVTHLWLILSIEWFLSSILVSVWQDLNGWKIDYLVNSRWYFVILYLWTMWL